jgi:hypothetical protein
VPNDWFSRSFRTGYSHIWPAGIIRRAEAMAQLCGRHRQHSQSRQMWIVLGGGISM